MDDMTEKVARAICEADGCDPDGIAPSDSLTQESEVPWLDYIEMAQAAIRAVLDGIREPNEAMKNAAYIDAQQGLSLNPYRMHTAMIDELRNRYD